MPSVMMLVSRATRRRFGPYCRWHHFICSSEAPARRARPGVEGFLRAALPCLLHGNSWLHILPDLRPVNLSNLFPKETDAREEIRPLHRPVIPSGTHVHPYHVRGVHTATCGRRLARWSCRLRRRRSQPNRPRPLRQVAEKQARPPPQPVHGFSVMGDSVSHKEKSHRCWYSPIRNCTSSVGRCHNVARSSRSPNWGCMTSACSSVRHRVASACIDSGSPCTRATLGRPSNRPYQSISPF